MQRHGFADCDTDGVSAWSVQSCRVECLQQLQRWLRMRRYIAVSDADAVWAGSVQSVGVECVCQLQCRAVRLRAGVARRVVQRAVRPGLLRRDVGSDVAAVQWAVHRGVLLPGGLHVADCGHVRAGAVQRRG